VEADTVQNEARAAARPSLTSENADEDGGQSERHFALSEPHGTVLPRFPVMAMLATAV